MDELRTDLEELLGDGDLVMSTVDVIADRLTRLGYLKVVRCGECKRPEHREPGMVWCPLRLGSWMVETAYCSEGERVVAKNATDKEVSDGR